jgi:hypothetical protein
MKTFMLASCGLVVAFALAGAQPRPFETINASVVLKVNDREATARSLIKTAEGMDGYFSLLGDEFIVFKIPVAKADTFLTVCDIAGLIIARRFELTDNAPEIADRETRLKARRDLLKDYFDMLRSSSAGSVLTVEKAIADVTTEIESLEAELSRLRYQLEYGEIRVDFKFHERTPPLRSARSLFNWINDLNLVDLRRDFEDASH